MRKFLIVFVATLFMGATPLSVTPMFDEVDCCIKECS